MIDDKIRHAALAIGTLAGNVKPEHWDLLACIKREMLDAADQVEMLERVLPIELLGDVTLHTVAEEYIRG